MDSNQIHQEILEILAEIQQEEDIEKKLLSDIKLLSHVLHEPIDMNLRVDRCRKILEDLDEDPALDMYVRTQLWNISALLEQL